MFMYLFKMSFVHNICPINHSKKSSFFRMRRILIKPFLYANFVRHAMASSASSSLDGRSRNVLEPEAYMVNEKRDFVVKNINRVISNPTCKLFAVIYIQNVAFAHLFN
jgi:hypothetical protein